MADQARPTRARADRKGSALSRRGFLAGAAGATAASALQWTPVFQVLASSAASTLPTPPNLPAGITLYQ